MTAVRRTQAERRETTQAKLVDAAIESLVEQGWAATTAVEVCARAGLTRGAFHHHFDSLPQLHAAALQHIYDDLRAAAPTDPPADLPDLIDALYEPTRDPRFKAVIEAWMAMANDPELRTELEPVVVGFAGLLGAGAGRSKVLRTKAAKDHYFLARETILGLALGRATNAGRPLPHEAAAIARLKATCP